MMSASAVLPEPRASMMPMRPGFNGTGFDLNPCAFVMPTDVITCEGRAPLSGVAPTKLRLPGSRHACFKLSNKRLDYGGNAVSGRDDPDHRAKQVNEH